MSQKCGIMGKFMNFYFPTTSAYQPKSLILFYKKVYIRRTFALYEKYIDIY